MLRTWPRLAGKDGTADRLQTPRQHVSLALPKLQQPYEVAPAVPKELAFDQSVKIRLMHRRRFVTHSYLAQLINQRASRLTQMKNTR